MYSLIGFITITLVNKFWETRPFFLKFGSGADRFRKKDPDLTKKNHDPQHCFGVTVDTFLPPCACNYLKCKLEKKKNVWKSIFGAVQGRASLIKKLTICICILISRCGHKGGLATSPPPFEPGALWFLYHFSWVLFLILEFYTIFLECLSFFFRFIPNS